MNAGAGRDQTKRRHSVQQEAQRHESVADMQDQQQPLPPGPIASPGTASLRAALEPADTDYIYFVARPDGSGRHQFSKDIAAHRQAATQYRRGLAK